MYHKSTNITLPNAAGKLSNIEDIQDISKSTTRNNNIRYFSGFVKVKAYSHNLLNNFFYLYSNYCDCSVRSGLRLLTYSSPLFSTVHYYYTHQSSISIQHSFFYFEFKIGRDRLKEFNNTQGCSLQGYVYYTPQKFYNYISFTRNLKIF